MEVRQYGKPDADDTLLRMVMNLAQQRDAKLLWLILKPRVPMGARPCQHPGSLTYEFSLDNGPMMAVRQYASGKIERFGW